MMRHLFQRMFARKPARPKPTRCRAFRPTVELLEDRLTPTVIDTVNFTESIFAHSPSLSFATGMAWAPDGSNRLFVTRQAGEIRIIENGQLLSTPFATVIPTYSTCECGLQGMAFDRDFINNHYVYFFVSVSNSEQQIIRYEAQGNTGINKTILLPDLPGTDFCHLGGGLAIGPDNKLYFTVGDLCNFSGVDGNLTSLASKIGRANLDGTIPTDNPFYDGPGGNNDYIWGRGFRNAYGLTFQESTGRLWADVAGLLYEQIFQVNAGDHAGWDNYENNQPAGFLTPKIKYRTNGVDTRTLTGSGAVRNNNVVTFTTTTTHGFRMGEKISLSGVADSSFNGTFYIASVPSNTTFTVSQTGPNATSGGGSATTQNLGGSVTGGTFYSSTQFAPAYQGNYFFADYNSSRVHRATLDANNNITSVDYFVYNVPSAVDVEIGPDGALYYVGVTTNTVYRLTYNTTVQNLVVTPTNLNMVEGGASVFGVRLAVQPSSNITVNVARTTGDSDITITSGASLTFTPANWDTPQYVFLAAAPDADSTNDTATFTVSAAGLPTQTVTVGAVDNATQSVIVSTTSLTINEGGSGTFTVRLANQPSGPVTVSVARTAGDSAITVASGATLTFTPTNYATPQTVTIAAAEDADSLDDTATISVSTVGVSTRTVTVTALDNDPAAPMITSTAVTTAVVNAAYRYDVNASGNPAPTYALLTAPAGMSINSTTGLISWTPPTTGTVNVTVQAANGVLPNANQAYTITVNPDMPPTASLTMPMNGQTVSGTMAEFFGDGVDDVGTERAEFYIDGVLRYTDVNSLGHYHYGGRHLQWDTTTLSNGPHTLRFVVYDTAGQSGFQQVTVTVDNTFSVIIDNSDPAYSEPAGAWFTYPFGYNGPSRRANAVSGSIARWPVSGLAPGSYTVQVTWPAESASDATYSIYDGATSTTPLATVVIDQRVEPVGPIFGGRPFQTIATVNITSGTLRVELESTPSGRVIADAVRVAVAGPSLPVVNITATDATAAEQGADPGLFTLSRTGSTSAALTVTYTISGTATNGSDYSSLSTSVTIPVGAASANLTITPIDDTVAEGDETVVLTLASSPSYTIGTPSSATVTIADNDTPAGVIIDNGQAGYSEPAGTWFNWSPGYNGTSRYANPGTGDIARWTVSGLAPGGYTVQVTWPADTASNAPYRIYDGATSTTPLVTVLVDQRAEPVGGIFGGRPFQTIAMVNITTGTLRVELESTPSGWVIADAVRVSSAGGALPVVSLTATDANAAEQGADPGVFTLSRTGSTTTALTVSYTISGTATNGSDYSTIGTSVTIPAGAASANMTITPIDDTLGEGNETVILTLSSSPSYAIGMPSSATVTIADNDATVPPILLDNGQPGYSEIGQWFDWPQGYNGNSRYANPGEGAMARWTASGLASGNYTVQLTWPADTASNVAWRIYDNVTLRQAGTVDQRGEPVGIIVGGRPFQTLATVQITSGTLRLELDSNASGWVIADAIRIVPA